MKILTRQEEQILLVIHQLKDRAYLVTIRERLMDITNRDWPMGAVYMPLNRLHKLGYLDARIGEAQNRRGRNKIKYYLLTRLAYEALEEILRLNEALWADFAVIAK
ncbi:helix-turn-helix transcriptional regulator [bacterium]|nr:helix-turn-helix transcriptional regulator [bacterium]